MEAPTTENAYVDLPMLEPLLQVVIYRFVRDLADECEVGHADFFLLGALEDGLANLWLGPASSLWLSGRILLTTGSFSDSLVNGPVSAVSAFVVPERVFR